MVLPRWKYVRLLHAYALEVKNEIKMQLLRWYLQQL